jgi:hypothetical protein
LPKQDQSGDTTTVQIPRSLKNARDCRREMVALYKQAKRRQIEPHLAGRLIFILNSIVGVDQGAGIDERLRQLEERLGMVRPNGHDRSELRP